MGVEVVYAAGAVVMFVAGWCSKRHSCRVHTARPAHQVRPALVRVERADRPVLERSR